MTREDTAPRLHCIADSPARSEALEALVRVVAPAAQVSHAPQSAAPAAVPAADAVVIDVGSPGSGTAGAEGEAVTPALEAVRRLRAGGFTGEVVVVSEAMQGPNDPASEELARLGAAIASPARLPALLVSALTAALAPRAAEPDAATLLAQLARTRQLLSAGEIAIGLQHAMNNPLAAILAESQLLEMDALSVEQREAVVRIVALCRRMTAVVRRLDGVGAPLGGVAPATGDR